MATKKKGKRKARNPTGLRPGELMSDYPRLTVRVPDSTVATLRRLAEELERPQWRILHEAIEAYAKSQR